MKPLSIRLLAATVLLAVPLLLAPSPAADNAIKLGDKVEKLTFKDIRYLPRTLDDFPKATAFVLVFGNTYCPVAQRYLPALKDLDKDYRDKGAQLLLVNAAEDDGIVAMAAHAVEHGLEFPVVKDFDGAAAKALGVTRTPEAVVLDAERRLRYRGRIDDQYRLGGVRPAPTRHDLREALDAVLAGGEVKVQETPVDGCPITFPKPKPASREITWADHVAPLVQKHCQECHRPGAAAPFALLTYRQVAARADAIAEVVREGRMPPWYADPEHGTFINRRGLTPEERDTLLQWVRAGTPKGDESKGPPSPFVEKADKWRFGTPDLVVEVPFAHELPASGDVQYKYAVIPHVFAEDTWVQGVQILPDNPRVVHHCNLVFVSGSEGYKATNFITGLVPGNGPMELANGVAFRIPKGSALALQIHYVTTGKEEKCKIAVGLRFAREIVQRRLKHLLLIDNKFAIPPGAPAHPVSVTRTLDEDAVGVGMFIHMHLRGKDVTFRALLPDGTSETLLVVPNYNFDWQVPYRWEPGKMKFPKGTRIECVAHYDNSPFNPYNPDPTATVREGPQTYHEMMNGFVFYTGADEQLGLEIDPKTGHVRAKEEKP